VAPILPDQYLSQVLQSRTPSAADRLKAIKAYASLSVLLRQWAHVYLAGIHLSGSFAKGTAVRGDTDLDINVCLKKDTPGSLRDLYYHLDAFLRGNGLTTSLRNVSIRVVHSGLAVDIVPGRQQHLLGGAQSLYFRKSDTWIQTNIFSHVKLIKESTRKKPICLIKIWRRLRSLDFPSFYLELAVLEALKGQLPFGLERNVLTVLSFLARDLPARRIVDPANSNNIVSDELSDEEKRAISLQASKSLQATNWGQIIW
jgi:hypothetical protein